MSRSIWGFWVCLVVLMNSVPSGGAFAQEEASSVDDREASFLPPPESLLKVAPVEAPLPSDKDTASAKTSVEPPKTTPDKAAQKLTTPPPFIPAAPVAVKPEPAPQPPVTVESVIEKVKAAPAPAVPQPTKPEPDLPITEPVVIPSAPVAAPSQLAPVTLGEAVAQTTLADVDPETLGLLSVTSGGLGTSLWKDTSRGIVDRLMPAVALPTSSATMNDLARRTFLSTAAAPLSTDHQKPTRSLLSQRIEALMSLGAVAEAWKLAALADPKLVDEVTLRLLTEAALIGPDSKAVCDKVPSMMAAHATTEETGSEWQKALLVCQLRAGDTKAVQLGIDLMREQNAKDSVFLSLINKNVLANSPKLPRQLTPLRPSTLAVLRQINLPLPPELYARAEASMIPELLRAKSSDETARILLAEKSATKGLLTAAQLGDVYKDVVFSPEDSAKDPAQTAATVVSRTMAAQALLTEQAPQKKIDLTQKLMAGLEPASMLGAQGALIAAHLESVPVTTDFNAFAVTLARTFALAGKPDKAMAWLKLARASSAQGSEIKAQLTDSWPLFVLSGLVPDGEYAQGLKAWMDKTLTVKEGEDGNVVHERRALCSQILLLLNAAGYAVGEDAWQLVIEPTLPTKQWVPSALLVERLAQAASAGRKGEVILLALLLEGAGDELSKPLSVRIAVLRALRQVGLLAESQAYAREILIGLGT